jgi:ATP-binding cassette subfamily C protein CydD
LTLSQHLQQQSAGGEIRFEEVSYTYDEQRPALCGVSFAIPSGKKVALVGPSGAGKSTIIHLLLCFLEPERGNITVNGEELQALPAAEWRKRVAWVPQRPYLFNATVRENIAIGQPGATREEIIEAAKRAYAHEFIQALPHGYETVIGERGACLSGGQVQRLSLARAFLKDAPLLILDEATSQLDSETETLVLAATEQLMCGRTVLIAAHRLSTVSDADQIIVLDGGRVVETGTHQSLTQQSGLYKQLVRAYEGESV